MKLGTQEENSHPGLTWSVRNTKESNNATEETNLPLLITVKHTFAVDNSIRVIDIFIHVLRNPPLALI